MKVSRYLKSVRANKFTFYNLDEATKNEFKALYKYLVKHKDKDVYSLITKISINQIDSKTTDYIYKFKKMQVISTNIKH